MNDLSDGIAYCGNCNKPLSVAPIFHSQLFSVCGRCKDIMNEGKYTTVQFIRQGLYEVIAKYMTFPCAYAKRGCNNQLTWGSVENHEDLCIFRKVKCPVPLCLWEENDDQLSSHIRNDHVDLFYILPALKVRMRQKIENGPPIFFELDNSVIMIVFTYRRNADKYYCKVYSDMTFSQCSSYKYQLKIFNIDEEDNLTFSQDKFEKIEDNHTADVTKNSIQIDGNVILSLVGDNEDFYITFLFFKSSGESEVSISETSVENRAIGDDSQLNDLTCPVCMDYLNAPIYRCINRHSICNKCHSQIEICPICRIQMQGHRHTSLERLAEVFKFPCQHKMYGCTVEALLQDLRIHEDVCSFQRQQCFARNCNWKGWKNEMVDHIIGSHRLLVMDDIGLFLWNEDYQEYILCFEEEFFLMKMKCDQKSLDYIVESCTNREQQYMYKLEIMGYFKNDVAIGIWHLCKTYDPATSNNDVFEGTSLPLEFLTQFLPQVGEIQFKVHFKRINK